MSLEVQQLIKYMRDNVDIPMISSYAKRTCKVCMGKGFCEVGGNADICSCVYKNVKKVCKKNGVE